jgi:hypothetical protein
MSRIGTSGISMMLVVVLMAMGLGACNDRGENASPGRVVPDAVETSTPTGRVENAGPGEFYPTPVDPTPKRAPSSCKRQPDRCTLTLDDFTTDAGFGAYFWEGRLRLARTRKPVQGILIEVGCLRQYAPQLQLRTKAPYRAYRRLTFRVGQAEGSRTRSGTLIVQILDGEDRLVDQLRIKYGQVESADVRVAQGIQIRAWLRPSDCPNSVYAVYHNVELLKDAG